MASPLGVDSKTDVNNGGGLGSDFVGGSWTYPDANYSERRRLFDAHVTYHPNSSVDAPVVEMIRTAAAAVKGPVLVVLDSNHAASFVIKELEAYAPMVTVGSYLVVEDMKLDRMLHGIDAKEDGAKQWAGPTPAVQAFLKANRQFRADRGVESLWYTQHPAGFLKRTR